MARKAMTTLRADMVSAWPDNITQEISPADLRSNVTDFVDTVTPAYAVTVIDPAVTGVSVGETAQDLTAWNNTLRQDAEFTINNTTGEVTINTPCVIDFTVYISAAASVNEELLIQTVYSGSTFNYSDQATMRGAARQVALSVTGLYDASDMGTFKCQIANESGTASYDFLSGGLILRLVPLIEDA